MKTTHEEANTILFQQTSRITNGNVLIVADDTDIFVLLLHFRYKGNLQCHIFMSSPVAGRALIDIDETIEKHKDISYLIAANGLTGCDTVACYFGIDKQTALKVLRSGKFSLDLLGNVTSDDASNEDILEQASKFILACYGQSKCQSLTEARQKILMQRVGRTKASAPSIFFITSNKLIF